MPEKLSILESYVLGIGVEWSTRQETPKGSGLVCEELTDR